MPYHLSVTLESWATIAPGPLCETAAVICDAFLRLRDELVRIEDEFREKRRGFLDGTSYKLRMCVPPAFFHSDAKPATGDDLPGG
jgi:hypothetical protein